MPYGTMPLAMLLYFDAIALTRHAMRRRVAGHYAIAAIRVSMALPYDADTSPAYAIFTLCALVTLLRQMPLRCRHAIIFIFRRHVAC